MTDTRLKDCLDRWDGELPAPICAEVRRLQAKKFPLSNYVLASIARICRLQYKPDLGSDHWRTPTETWENKGGDCEDIAILTGAMVQAVFPGMRIELVLCWETEAIGEALLQGHAVLCAHRVYGLVYIDNKVRVLYDEATFRKQYEEHSRLEWPA